MFGLFTKEKTLEALKKDFEDLHKIEADLWILLNQNNKEELFLNIQLMNTIISQIILEFDKLDLELLDFSENEKKEIETDLKLLEDLLKKQVEELSEISKLNQSQIELILNQNKTINPNLSTISSLILQIIEKIKKTIKKPSSFYNIISSFDLITKINPKKELKSYDLKKITPKNPKPLREKENPTPLINPLRFEPTIPIPIVMYRDENGHITWETTLEHKFASDRDFSRVSPDAFSPFGTGWEPERSMREIPLYISGEEVFNINFTEDFNKMPESLKQIFLSKKILRTSGNTKTNYSVVMSTTPITSDEDISEGRTGTLLENGKPVIVTINNKDFIVEIKGVGCPDGNNSRINPMSRSGYFGSSEKQYGGANISEIEREFEHLEIQRNEHLKLFEEGNSIRAIGKIDYKTLPLEGLNEETKELEQSYLIRLSPSNIRSSYRQNSFFSKLNNDNSLVVIGIAVQYAHLMKLPSCLLHSTIHPENFVKCNDTYILTDFSDCRKLKDLENPYDFISKVLPKIGELPEIKDEEIILFYKTILNELNLEYPSNLTEEIFIEILWSQFLVQKVYLHRKGKTILADKEKNSAIAYFNEFIPEKILQNDSQTRLFINGILNFMKIEENILLNLLQLKVYKWQKIILI